MSLRRRLGGTVFFRLPAVFPVTTMACVWLVASAGCTTKDESAIKLQPLGWAGPVEARETRRWSREDVESVPTWKVAEEPSLVVIPDLVRTLGATRQREVDEAAFHPDGRVVLLFNPDQSAQEAMRDSVLLHFIDPASGEETEVAAPTGKGGRFLDWVDFGMAADDDRIVLIGPNRQGVRTEDIWYFDWQGESRRAPSHAPAGRPLGVFPDGSVVIAGDWGSESADTVMDFPIMSLRSAEAGSKTTSTDAPDTLFAAGIPKDPTRLDYPASWGHMPFLTSAIAGDTIWIVPTEQPTLLAVNRAGDAVLKVQWETGDRVIPPASPHFGRGAERYPAATNLKIGTDGLLYIQKVSMRDGLPVRGPEWLVFSPAGELLARLEVPGNLWVLAFGDGALVATRTDDNTGLQEVRVHALRST